MAEMAAVAKALAEGAVAAVAVAAVKALAEMAAVAVAAANLEAVLREEEVTEVVAVEEQVGCKAAEATAREASALVAAVAKAPVPPRSVFAAVATVAGRSGLRRGARPRALEKALFSWQVWLVYFEDIIAMRDQHLNACHQA